MKVTAHKMAARYDFDSTNALTSEIKFLDYSVVRKMFFIAVIEITMNA